jgi:hypothetical protein
MQLVHRAEEHVYGLGGMHMELCADTQRRQPQCGHDECDGPACCCIVVCRSPPPPKPGKEATTLFQRQLKRSLPFIFYSFFFLCICSSVTSGRPSIRVPTRIMTDDDHDLLQPHLPCIGTSQFLPMEWNIYSFLAQWNSGGSVFEIICFLFFVLTRGTPSVYCRS